MGTWRSSIRPKVAKVIRDNPNATVKQLRRALLEARKFYYGSQSWQTRIWNDEVKLQLGLKAEKKRHCRSAKQHPVAGGQLSLLEESDV